MSLPNGLYFTRGCSGRVRVCAHALLCAICPVPTVSDSGAVTRPRLQLSYFIYRFTLFSASFAMANAGEAQAAQAAVVDGEQAVHLAVVKVWADWLLALDTGIHFSHVVEFVRAAGLQLCVSGCVRVARVAFLPYLQNPTTMIRSTASSPKLAWRKDSLDLEISRWRQQRVFRATYTFVLVIRLFSSEVLVWFLLRKLFLAKSMNSRRAMSRQPPSQHS